MLKQYLALGKIVGTHGIKGELKLNPWCDSPEFTKKFKTLYFDDEGKEKIGVLSARPHSNVALLMLENIISVDEAQTLRNKVLYFKREDAHLPENTWYIEDLIGCKVKELDTEKVYGTITNVEKFPANDVWTVKDDSGKETLVPAIKPVIIKTDIENGIIEIKALKGLFDEPESVIEDEN